MLLNSILILCVRICPQACIRDDTTMNKHKKSRQGKIECKTLKIWSRHTFKQPDLKAKLRVTTLHEQRKKLIASVLMVIATIVRLFLKKWVVIWHSCPCQEAIPSLIEDDIKRGTKRREMDELRKDYIREK